MTIKCLAILTNIALIVCIAGCDNTNSDVDKILRAKDIVRSQVNFPDTLSFHEMQTQVSGNTVTLTFTAKNAFGVPSTYTKSINVH